MKLAPLHFGLLWLAANAYWPTALYGQSLEGNWESEGYGYYFSIVGSKLEAYEVTAISCIFGFSGIRQTESAADDSETFKVVEEPDTFAIRTDTDQFIMAESG